ncbi:ANTAR domain-containing protein [Mycobacterium spongiae]|uniref:ANTAR domain-containing protein n=1 Tax=Mycobacterium spongiae TaxID=886343 RepID=UPI001FEB1F65|nr:ANTAR domain-containing protein [Mycobacterium spongiae]
MTRRQNAHPGIPRRAGQRRLGAAEGVLVALLGCTLDEAFTDIVHTAKRHNVAPMELADALVSIAEKNAPGDPDDPVVAAAYRAWGDRLGDTVRH